METVLTHARGCTVSGKLLLANNASGAAFGLVQRTTVPILTYASLTRGLREDEQILLGGKPVRGLTPGDPFGSTIRRTPDRRIIVKNSFSFSQNGRSIERHLKRCVWAHRASFARRCPMLQAVHFDYTWGGCLAISRNHAGHFGELARNVYGAHCCNGLSVPRRTITNSLLADWLAGKARCSLTSRWLRRAPHKDPPPALLSIAVDLSLRLGQSRAVLDR